MPLASIRCFEFIMEFLVFLIFIICTITCCVKSRTFGVGFLHLINIGIFQVSCLLAIVLGYTRPSFSQDYHVYQLVTLSIAMISFTLPYLWRKPPTGILGHPTLRKYASSSRASYKFTRSLLFLSCALELVIYISIFITTGFAGRVEISVAGLGQFSRLFYYIPIILVMLMFSLGVPPGDRKNIAITFCVPKFLIGFFGARIYLATATIPLLLIFYGRDVYSYLTNSFALVSRLRFKMFSLFLPLIAVLSFALLFFAPLFIRGDSINSSSDYSFVALVFGEYLGYAYWLGFSNTEFGADSIQILWPLSSFFDIYIQPIFDIHPLFRESLINMPMRYDRFMTFHTMGESAIGGTGGSYVGELSASGLLVTVAVAVVLGFLASAVDFASHSDFQLADPARKRAFSFLAFWFAIKIAFVARFTISEIFDMIPLLLFFYYIANSVLRSFSSTKL